MIESQRPMVTESTFPRRQTLPSLVWIRTCAPRTWSRRLSHQPSARACFVVGPRTRDNQRRAGMEAITQSSLGGTGTRVIRHGRSNTRKAHFRWTVRGTGAVLAVNVSIRAMTRLLLELDSDYDYCANHDSILTPSVRVFMTYSHYEKLGSGTRSYRLRESLRVQGE